MTRGDSATLDAPFKVDAVSIHNFDRDGFVKPAGVLDVALLDTADIIATQPTNERPRIDALRWSGGSPAGHAACSHLSPVLYRR